MITVRSMGSFSLLASPMARAAGLGVVAVVALLSIYHETLFSMVEIWIRSETYAHCFLIFPISGYLIWRRGPLLVGLTPAVDYRPLPLFALLGFLWLLANVAEIAVLEQFSVIAMIPVLLWAILGWEVVSEIAFPLGFLLFSVPFGEFLVPRLINFTADFTVGMLKLTGIPVYRDGVYFSIPSGDWSVVDACSGLRYLIASITLGCLFAYINYNSWKKRVLFIGLASIVPIIANGLRAYMIVMIGHFSDMKLAVGVDHFIYGWVFFGLVMALLFWFGAKWAEDEASGSPISVKPPLAVNKKREVTTLAMAVVALAVSALWPMRVASINKQAMVNAVAVRLPPIESKSPWQPVESMTDWEPSYVGVTDQRKVCYSDGQHSVVVFLQYYRGQAKGRELVNSQNFLLSPKKQPQWKVPSENLANANLLGHSTMVLQGTVKSVKQEFLTWRWYWINGEHTANDYFAKLLEAKAKLLSGTSDEAGIIVAVEVGQNQAAARVALQSFVDAMLPSIEQSLNKAAKEVAQ